MLIYLKKLFCKHHYELYRWHICHGPNGNDPAMIEAEYVCKKCGKHCYKDDSITKIEKYKNICDIHERRNLK